MSAPMLLELQGVHTHIGAYHILHGVDQEWADTWLGQTRSRLVDAGVDDDVLALLPNAS